MWWPSLAFSPLPLPPTPLAPPTLCHVLHAAEDIPKAELGWLSTRISRSNDCLTIGGGPTCVIEAEAWLRSNAQLAKACTTIPKVRWHVLNVSRKVKDATERPTALVQMGERIAGIGEDADPNASPSRRSFSSAQEERSAMGVSSPRKSKVRTLHDYAEDGDLLSSPGKKLLEEAHKKKNIDERDPILNLTPLMICCKEGHAKAAKDLIQKGADVNLENVNHWTPLMLAVDGGHEEVVELLLTHEADVAFVGRYGYTVLHQAVYRRHAGVLRLLVGECLEQLDVPNDKGFTPLHIASRHGHEECVDILLRARADPTSQPEMCNLNTPLVSRGPTRIDCV